MSGKPWRRVLRALLWVVAGGLIAAVTLVAAMWLDHRADTRLPVPTGPWSVGRSIQVWTDDTVDPLAPVPNTTRELLAWIWYPAEGDASDTADDYLPPDLVAATNQWRGSIIGQVLTRDLSKVRAHSRRDPEISARQPSYPVVLMRAGASAGVENYSALAEDLASHGYIVVGVNAPYRTGVVTFPDGRVIFRTAPNNPEICVGRSDQERCAARILDAWTADQVFVVNRLERLNSGAIDSRFRSRVDTARIGAFGHSFGGAAAALFCAADARCKAAVNVDGAPHGRVVQEGVRQPFLFLLSDHAAETDAGSLEIVANIQSQYEHSPVATRHQVVIAGASHFLFSDDGALLKSPVLQTLLRSVGALGIDGRRQLAATSFCLRSFFDAYLKGTAVHPTLQTAAYPEIRTLE